jgi:hypothetical protein
MGEEYKPVMSEKTNVKMDPIEELSIVISGIY